MLSAHDMSLIHPAVQVLAPFLLAMVSDTVKLEQVFDPKVLTSGLAELVKNFDFSQLSVKDETKDDYLHLDLAPSFGGLTKEDVKAMDEQLKVMISGTMRALEKERQKGENISWETVVSVMTQNPLLEPFGDEIVRSDKLIKEGNGFFKFDGSPDRAIVEQVNSWFAALIQDEDVLKSTHIDINVMGAIVAQTGAMVNSIGSLLYMKEEHRKTLVDIGVLRFPDLDNPFFKVYRIKLVAWSRSARVLVAQQDKNGIVGEFASRRFRPRKSVMDKLSRNTVNKAVAEAEALFSPIGQPY
ncbi:hypothetical protein GY45DRAFT_795182 [Cubamyces sp. BRFM 1775]|nr:hypothetical protein GY45DRAFT_795182 [Cubamyces sp. BRFM 1775]